MAIFFLRNPDLTEDEKEALVRELMPGLPDAPVEVGDPQSPSSDDTLGEHDGKLTDEEMGPWGQLGRSLACNAPLEVQCTPVIPESDIVT